MRNVALQIQCALEVELQANETLMKQQMLSTWTFSVAPCKAQWHLILSQGLFDERSVLGDSIGLPETILED